MTDKQKIAALEKRVQDLEARPLMPTIIVLPAMQPIPYFQPFPYIPPYTIPYQPYQPWYGNTSGALPWGMATTTAGGAVPFAGKTFLEVMI